MSFLTPTAPLLELCIDLSTLLHLRDLRDLRENETSLDLEAAARLVEAAGADAIRLSMHAADIGRQRADIAALQSSSALPLQISAAPEPALIELLAEARPQMVCFALPQSAGSMQTASFDVGDRLSTIRAAVQRLDGVEVAITLSADTDPTQLQSVIDAGICAIELHTARFATAHGEARDAELKRLNVLATQAVQCGLRVQVAHGLTLQNLPQVLALSQLTQATIGHSVAMRALMVGLQTAVGEFKACLLKPARLAAA